MFENCPLTGHFCGFCGISNGVYYCGTNVRKKRKKGEKLETEILKLGYCPLGKTENQGSANILNKTSAIITDKTIGD